MAVTETKLALLTGSVDGDGHKNYQAIYHVYVSTSLDGPDTVINAVIAVAPATWTFGNDNNLFLSVTGIGQAQLIDMPGTQRKWQVPVSYSTKPIPGTASHSWALDPFTSPTAEPWKVSGTFVRGQRFTYHDKNGNLITLQGTNELKGVEIPDGHDTVHLEGWTSGIDLPDRSDAVFHVNSLAMWGLSARTILLLNWTFQLFHRGSDEYVFNVFDFEIKRDIWNEEYLNASYKKVNPNWATGEPLSKKLMSITDYGGQPELHPIDADGNECEFSAAPLNIAAVLQEFNFLTLGIPNPLPGPFT